MSKPVAHSSEIFEEMVKKLQQIPAVDRVISFERNGSHKRLTVHGKTADALIFIIENIDEISAGIRNVEQARQSLDRMKSVTELVIPAADPDFFERVRQILVNFEGRTVLCHVDEMAGAQHGIQELLEANNRYLEDARAARRELNALKEKVGYNGN